MTNTGTGKRVFEAQLPSDDGATSLEGYSTGSSNPEAFLAQIMRDYPDFAALIEAKTVKETKALVADVDPRRYTPLIALLKAASFHLGKLGRIENELAASRAWVEIVRLVDPKRLDSFFGNTQPRNLGDALGELGGWYSKQGHLDMALKSFEEAERCYEDDAALRAQAGITRPSEADILLGLRNFRSLLYAQLSRVHAGMGNLRRGRTVQCSRLEAFPTRGDARRPLRERAFERARCRAGGRLRIGPRRLQPRARSFLHA
jgi:tetratricopeptide (TPR) repeat protein